MTMPISPNLAYAAMLADPQCGSLLAAAPTTMPNAEEIARLLPRNKVSLLPALHSGRDDLRVLLAMPPLARYLAEEQRSYDQSRREYATIRAAFAGQGFPDVLIKSAGMAPSFPHLSDNVDDLVPADRIPDARIALRSLGYVELRNLEEPRKFFFKRFAGGQQVAAHHLHEHVGWAVSFLDEPLLFERARLASDDPELLIPHPQDAFLITTAHALYENKAFKLGDLVKVRQCLRSGQMDWQQMADLAGRKGWIDGLNILIAVFARLDAAVYGASLFPAPVIEQAGQVMNKQHAAYINGLFAGDISLPMRVGFRFSKRLFYAKCWHDRQRSAGEKAYDIVRHTLNGTKLKLSIHSQPGILVTFSGMDGSGKTLHAQALDNAFRLCDIRTSFVWSRTGSSRLTGAMFAAGRTLLHRPPSGAATTQEQRAGNRRQMLRNPLVRQVWIATVVADLLWQYTRRVRLPLLAGRVVICDRYVYDALADIAAVTGSSAGLLCRLLVMLSPKPSRAEMYGMRGIHTDVQARAAFLLRVPPETAVSRREGELSQVAAEQTRNIYAGLASRYSLVSLDNSPPFAEVSDPLVRGIVGSYFARYHTMINALLMANPHTSSR
jgi:thymidylate kinase